MRELIHMVDEHAKKYDKHPPTIVQWENLVDAAFLAHHHHKPKSFRKAIELIISIFGICAQNQIEIGIENLSRVSSLIGCAPPTDETITVYVLGDIKGTIRACRQQYLHLDTTFKEKIEKEVGILLRAYV
ncbi:MAG: hypothetical protein HYV32_03535 [Candidatus Kerfeldbacteria bacterium]|nr:hypothetical protein [Candidatus Kerfeldbacteria bacterium]